MKKKRKVFIIALILLMSLGFYQSVSAYIGTYDFTIRHSVDGRTKHALSAKPTSTTAKGQTYIPSGAISTSKSSFQVFLVRFLKSYRVDPITANNTNYTKSFGKVTKSNYTVTVNKYSATGDHIIGSGKINQ